MPGYNDPYDIGNNPTYHTGEKCITEGCNNPAGTQWSPFWCFQCNSEKRNISLLGEEVKQNPRVEEKNKAIFMTKIGQKCLNQK